MKQNVEVVFNCGEVKQILILPETPIKVVFVFDEKEITLREQKGKPGLYKIAFQRGFPKTTGVKTEQSQIQKEVRSNKTPANLTLPSNLRLTNALQLQNSNEDIGKERPLKETWVPKITAVTSLSAIQLKNSNEVCSQGKPLNFSLPRNSTSITPNNYQLQNSSEVYSKGKPLNIISLPRNLTINSNGFLLHNSQNSCGKENPLNITSVPEISTFICSSNFQLQNSKTVCDKDKTQNITFLPKNSTFTTSNDFQLQNSKESFSKEKIVNITSPLPIPSKLINLNDLLLQNSVVQPTQPTSITGYGVQNKVNIDKDPGEKSKTDNLQRSPLNTKKWRVVNLGKCEQSFQPQQSGHIVYDNPSEQAVYKTPFESKVYNLHHEQSGECVKENKHVPFEFNQSTDSANNDVSSINTSTVSQSETKFCDTQNYNKPHEERDAKDSGNTCNWKIHTGVKCAFCSCYYRDKPGTVFHRFPKSPTRSNKWAEICGKKWVINATPAQRYNFKVCADHFRPSDYMNSMFVRLHSNAIPSLFISKVPNVVETIKEKLKKALNNPLPVKAAEAHSSSTTEPNAGEVTI